MTAPHASQIVDGYLARLELQLIRSAPVRRSELVEDIRAHIADARAGPRRNPTKRCSRSSTVSATP
jgi:hypothetical protein